MSDWFILGTKIKYFFLPLFFWREMEERFALGGGEEERVLSVSLVYNNLGLFTISDVTFKLDNLKEISKSRLSKFYHHGRRTKSRPYILFNGINMRNFVVKYELVCLLAVFLNDT